MGKTTIEWGQRMTGRNGEIRVPLKYGSSEKYIIWGYAAKQLPLGGFVETKCTSTKSFLKWLADGVSQQSEPPAICPERDE